MLELISGLVIGGLTGFFITNFIKNKEIEIERNKSKNVEELEDKFKSIAGDVLRLNSQDFLQLAKKDLENTKNTFNSEFQNKEKGVETLVTSINKTIDELEKKVDKFEKERGEQFGSLDSSIKKILESGEQLNTTTLTLKTALSSSGAVIGRWGEMVLKNILEDSGLIEGINFFIQETTGTEETLRPDVIINLPGGYRLVVDSKANLDEFLKAIEEKQADKRKEYLDEFISKLRARIRNLSSKEYQKHIDEKIPYVIMFIPGEGALRAALQRDINLYREAQEKKVMLASPLTIMPIITLIAHAWRQHKAGENAVKLGEEVIDLGGRLKSFFNHFSDIGSGLSKATEKFNSAVGSWDMKVYPKIEQINNLGGNIKLDSVPVKILEEPRISKKSKETLTLERPSVE